MDTKNLNVPQNEEEFKLEIWKTLARLETHVESLVGNGQPGRIRIIEKEIERHNWYFGVLAGAWLIVNFLSHPSILAFLKAAWSK